MLHTMDGYILYTCRIASLARTAYGYAYSSTVSTSSSVTASSNSIDLGDAEGHALSGTVTIPAPTNSGTDITQERADIAGTLIVNFSSGPCTVRFWADMPGAAWAYIEEITLTFDDTVISSIGGDTGKVSDAISGVSNDTHTFTIGVVYKDHVDYLTDDDGNSVFTAGGFTFAAGSDDPL